MRKACGAKVVRLLQQLTVGRVNAPNAACVNDMNDKARQMAGFIVVEKALNNYEVWF